MPRRLSPNASTDTPTDYALATMAELGTTMISVPAGATCPEIEDGQTMTPVTGGSCFEMHVGSTPDSKFTIDTTGMKLALFDPSTQVR